MEQESFEVSAPRALGRRRATAAQAPLRMRVDPSLGRVSLVDRLDRLSTHAVHELVPALLGTEKRTWVLDAADLEVTDAVGLRTLSALYRRLVRHGRELRVVDESPDVRAGLTRLRLDTHLLGGASPRVDALPSHWPHR